MNQLRFLTAFIVIILSIQGCGRYLRAVNPERLVPREVEELSAVVEPDQTVTISWIAPQSDLRGKKLKEMDGYLIQSATANPLSILSDKPVEKQYEDIETIPDTTFEILRKKQEDAEIRGDIVRKAKVKEEDRRYTYRVKMIPDGLTIYRVIPVNDEGGEGLVKYAVQVSKKDQTVTAAVIDSPRDESK